MRIYIQTEPYKQNSYMQHLIEHLVSRKSDAPLDFFAIDFPVTATSWLNYTSFYFNHCEANVYVDQIFQPFALKKIAREKKLIQEEGNQYQSNKTLLVNRLGKQLYGATFGWARPSFACNQAEIIKEHRKYYNAEHLWITDNDFKILQRPSRIRKKGHLEQDISHQTLHYSVRKSGYVVKLFEDRGAKTYALCYFLDWFAYVWAQYYCNHCARAYDFPQVEFFEYTQHLVLFFLESERDFFRTNIDEEFFIQAQRYFIGTDEYLQEIALISEIRYEAQYDLSELKNFINSLDLKTVQSLLYF